MFENLLNGSEIEDLESFYGLVIDFGLPKDTVFEANLYNALLLLQQGSVFTEDLERWWLREFVHSDICNQKMIAQFHKIKGDDLYELYKKTGSMQNFNHSMRNYLKAGEYNFVEMEIKKINDVVGLSEDYFMKSQFYSVYSEACKSIHLSKILKKIPSLKG